MAEYIEREDIEYPYMSMSMWGINSATCKAYNEGVKAVEDAISAMPAADVVEVVRCKDCVHHTEDIINEDIVWCEISGLAHLRDYYCAEGKGEGE